MQMASTYKAHTDLPRSMQRDVVEIIPDLRGIRQHETMKYFRGILTREELRSIYLKPPETLPLADLA